MSLNDRLVEVIKRVGRMDRTQIDLAITVLLVMLVCAVVFGMPAHGQLLLPDGTVNVTCAPTPRVPPLPVPAVAAPPQADLPTQATVTAAAGIPTPASLPAQIGGSGTKAVIDLNAKGAAIGWWVPQVGSVKLYLYGVTWEHLAKNPGLAARLLLLAAAPNRDSATVAAIGAAYAPTLHVLDMCDVWAPLVAQLNANRPAPLDPAAPPWKATGGSIFTFSSGRLIGVTSRKATAGAACNCTTKATVGANTYCPLAAGPATEATACKL